MNIHEKIEKIFYERYARGVNEAPKCHNPVPPKYRIYKWRGKPVSAIKFYWLMRGWEIANQ